MVEPPCQRETFLAAAQWLHELQVSCLMGLSDTRGKWSLVRTLLQPFSVICEVVERHEIHSSVKWPYYWSFVVFRANLKPLQGLCCPFQGCTCSYQYTISARMKPVAQNVKKKWTSPSTSPKTMTWNAMVVTKWYWVEIQWINEKLKSKFQPKERKKVDTSVFFEWIRQTGELRVKNEKSRLPTTLPAPRFGFELLCTH